MPDDNLFKFLMAFVAIFSPKAAQRLTLRRCHAMISKVYKEHKEFELMIASFALKFNNTPFSADSLLTLELMRSQNEEKLRSAMAKFDAAMDAYAST